MGGKNTGHLSTRQRFLVHPVAVAYSRRRSETLAKMFIFLTANSHNGRADAFERDSPLKIRSADNDSISGNELVVSRISIQVGIANRYGVVSISRWYVQRAIPRIQPRGLDYFNRARDRKIVAIARLFVVRFRRN